ncbi:MAG: ABC transporter permease subunit [Defluviitaleaceae bacterium]|nr:ABC transporter permease subunit [Defluviitaleaceae bacterium]
MNAISVGKEKKSKKGQGFWREMLRDLSRNRALYLLALPAIAWFIIFHYIPMTGIIIAFKDYNVIDGIFGSPWAGLRNFEFLIRSGILRRVTLNTLFLNALFLVFGLIAQVGIALLINEVRNKYFKRVSQGVLLLPFFISWVIVGTISLYLFGTNVGFLNTVRGVFGLDPINWYQSPQYWPAILTISHIWKSIGWGSIIYLAAIVSVDQEIYESAQLDGCNKIKQIRYITLPCITPTISIMMLLAIGQIFYGNFGMIYNMVRQNILLFPTTDIIDTYVFRALRGGGGGGQFAMAGAAGFVQSTMGFITVLIANKIVSKFNKDNALF